jgi:hypothetical protein
MISIATLDRLQAFGALAFKQLPDGRHLIVTPLLFGRAQLALDNDLDDEGYDDVWEYATPVAATRAMIQWDPATEAEPAGWSRHPATGRRRPGGDASKEDLQF